MDTQTTLTTPPASPAPTAGKAAMIALGAAATTGLSFVAGIFVHKGWIDATGASSFVTIGVPIVVAGGVAVYRGWRNYGSVIVTASLDILRARVLDAAAKARQNPTAAPAVLAGVAAHVDATTPLTGPAGPVEQAVADKAAGPGFSSAPKAAIALAIGIAALGLLLPGVAYAQGKTPVARPDLCDLDPLKLTPGCQVTPDLISSIKNQLGGASSTPALNSFSPQQIADKIAALALTDFIYADALAKSTKNLITEPCWAAWVVLLTQQQAPLIGPAINETVSWSGTGAVFSTLSPHNLMVGQALTFANPPAGLVAGTTYWVIAENYTATTFEVAASATGPAIVPTAAAANGSSITSVGQIMQRPNPGLVTNVEYLSEAVQLLQSNSPIAIACAPMASALQKDVATLLSSIVTGGAFGLFKLPIAIP
jgi:hypothetical protein